MEQSKALDGPLESAEQGISTSCRAGNPSRKINAITSERTEATIIETYDSLGVVAMSLLQWLQERAAAHGKRLGIC
jgi:hypothetical protein